MCLFSSFKLSMRALNWIACLFGSADAISQSGLYVLAAKYHTPSFSAAVTLGSAAAGLLVSLPSLLTRALCRPLLSLLHLEDREDTTGHELEALRQGCALLFDICAVVILGCVYSLFQTMKDYCARGGSWDTHQTLSSTFLAHDDNNDDEEDVWREEEETPSSSPIFTTSSPGISMQKIHKTQTKQQQQKENDFDNEHSPVLQSTHHKEIYNTHNNLKTSSSSSMKIPRIQSYTHIQQNSSISPTSSFITGVTPIPTIKHHPKSQHHYPNQNIFQKILHPSKNHLQNLLQHPRIKIYITTFTKTYKPTLSLFFNYFVTLSLFPGTIASIPPASSSENSGMLNLGNWLTIVLLTVFNGADVLGRYVLNVEWFGLAGMLLQTDDNGGESDGCGQVDVECDYESHGDGRDVSKNDYKDVDATEESADGTLQQQEIQHICTNSSIHHPNYNILVWYQTLLRFIFSPLIAYCILPPFSSSSSSTTLPAISSDLLRCLLLFLFGLTNGFITCANFMISPTMVTSEEERDASSFLLLLALYLGLTFGAYFGLVFDILLTWLQQ